MPSLFQNKKPQAYLTPPPPITHTKKREDNNIVEIVVKKLKIPEKTHFLYSSFPVQGRHHYSISILYLHHYDTKVIAVQKDRRHSNTCIPK